MEHHGFCWLLLSNLHNCFNKLKLHHFFPVLHSGSMSGWQTIQGLYTLLLMEEILHRLGCVNPCKSWGKLFINWLAGFLNHQQYYKDIPASYVSLYRSLCCLRRFSLQIPSVFSLRKNLAESWAELEAVFS